jgi:toxin YoeB
MVKQIIWSPTAEEEKKDILRFWIIHNQSPAYSIQPEDKINEALELLPYYPFIGKKTDFERATAIIADNCLVFY